MKRSEYKKEINRLIKLSQRLDERLDIQLDTAGWITNLTDDLTKRMDDAELSGCQQKEMLVKEAEALIGKISYEKRILEDDKKLEDQLGQELDALTLRVIKEGIEED